MTDTMVGAELGRLVGQLKVERQAIGLSTREAAARAQMNQGTLWRLETARTRPTFLRFARLVDVLGLRIELWRGLAPARAGQPWDLDLEGPEPRRLPLDWTVISPLQYRTRELLVHDSWSQQVREEFLRLHQTRTRIGVDLWWGRYIDLDPGLDAQAVCRLLGMSHHTLTAVEHGPGWPDMASIVLLAGLTRRRLELVEADLGPLVPPWAPPGAGA